MFKAINGKTILVTGGTGSFGKKFIEKLLSSSEVKKILVFSRDELKQFEMQQKYTDERLKFVLGDIRDRERLGQACYGIDIIVHAAAMKQVPASEYNPMEAIKTNIFGAENIIDMALDHNIEKVITLSTDKASNPSNLYGATKLCSDKLFAAANAISDHTQTVFSVVRYGNVINSRGSIVPLFNQQKLAGEITITDERMTRFWITLDQAVDFVAKCLSKMKGGEIFIPKIPSMKLTDVAEAIAPKANIKIIGIRPGEKLHEVMITEDDAPNTIEFDDYYVIEPFNEDWDAEILFRKSDFKRVPQDFSYSSKNNSEWLEISEFIRMAKINISNS